VGEAGRRGPHLQLRRGAAARFGRQHGVYPGFSQRKSGTDAFFHTDWIGSTRYLTAGNGLGIPTGYRFDAFGNQTAGAGIDQTSLKFAGAWGYQSDVAMHLQLLGARYYDPEVGRFLSPDPIGFAGGLNLYEYCHNNPVGCIDPDGTAPRCRQCGTRAMRIQIYPSLERQAAASQRFQQGVLSGIGEFLTRLPYAFTTEFGNPGPAPTPATQLLMGKEAELEDAILNYRFGQGGLVACGQGLDTFDQARNKALNWLTERGFKAEVVVLSKGLEGSPKGEPIGMMTADRRLGYRIEFDERSGAHINVWDRDGPKGKQNKPPHFQFQGSADEVRAFTRRFRRMPRSRFSK
jgi:RHS repeat-associated protein